MDFRFSEDQELLQTTVRDFLEKEVTPDVVREGWETETGRSPALWKKLAEIGVPGLLVPEEHGGMGMDEVDFVLLVEEAGRAGLAEPVVGTAAVAAPLLRELGGALGVAAQVGGEQGAALVAAAGSAFTDGIGLAFLVGAGVLAATAALVGVFYPREPSPIDEAAKEHERAAQASDESG